MADEPETLVTIHMSFPRLDDRALADHIAPVIREAIAAGGIGTTVSVLPYDPDAEEDDAS